VSIERAEQLRGKAVGVTRFGTVTDTAARLALRHLGLVPEKDVALLQIGGVETIVPAMQGGRVQAGMLSYPSITAAKKLGSFLTIASSANLKVGHFIENLDR
jgi:ABC-type nitrate/sulfonate/bicarbonate transport system substrate-binding protein